MSSFPLYDSLYNSKEISKKDLTNAQKQEIVDKINTFDENGRNLVYALIIFHNIKETADTHSYSLPYSGTCEEIKKGKENVTWNLNDLPTPLKHILYRFVLMHSQTMNENKDTERPV
jgi:hypothetical protein